MSISRRQFIKAGGAALTMGVLPYGTLRIARAASQPRTREISLVAAPGKMSLDGRESFSAWLYNGQPGGPEIRITEGEVLRVKLTNELPKPTTIHWHGVPVPNAMDGVPGVTQKAVAPGASFIYEFKAQPAGSYIYHSHQGLQLDQGLAGSLIIEPRSDPNPPDREYTLLLEDWAATDGGGPNASRRRPPMGGMMGLGMMGRGMRGRGMMGRRGMRGSGPPLEPIYDGYTVGGRAYPGIKPLMVKKGDRVRLRLCNASAITVYDLMLAGHKLTITHADANPVNPIETEVLRIAPGERYDVEFIANNPGRWLLMANESGYGESGLKVPVLYEGVRPGEAAPPVFRRGLRFVRYWDLVRPEPKPLEKGKGQGRFYRQVLSGGMHSSFWTINGYVYPQAEVLAAPLGERVRLSYLNRSPMPHPMHLHGHFFRVANPNLPQELWISKDTVIVEHMERVDIEFVADNPGRWIHHCHNLYHMEAGMANLVEVKA
jgi:FtsP/CotA-like multicopper oxidase with cupredoxin domain